MAEEWFTYSELGERLGISSEAARQKAIRYRWPRRTANDGRAQVRVDVEDVKASTTPRKPKEDPQSDDRLTPDDPPSDARTFAALEAHIETLKAIAAKAESMAERERERADNERVRAENERVRAENERARADAEKERADGVYARLEEVLAERRQRADADDVIQREVAELRSIIDKMRRPWWRRFGS